MGRMQKFFELEELDPKDREWTNRSGNGAGAGAVSISGRYVWTPTDEDDEEKNGVKDQAGGNAKDPKGVKTAAVAAGDAGVNAQVVLGEGREGKGTSSVRRQRERGVGGGRLGWGGGRRRERSGGGRILFA